VYEFIGSNPDGLLVSEDGAKPKPGVEFKTFGDRTSHDWGDEMTDQVPRGYRVQCEQTMLCCGLDDMYLYAFNRDRCTYHLYYMTADLELQQVMLEAEVQWWNRHMVEGIAPDPDETDSCTEALKKRWANGNGLTKVATEEIEIDCKRLQAVKAEIKALESEEKLLSNIIREFLGEASDLTLSFCEKPLTWRNNKSSEKIDWEAVADQYRAVLERRKVLVPRSLDRIRFQLTEIKPGPRVLRVPELKGAK
jgi:predicted phage-related endonuclease